MTRSESQATWTTTTLTYLLTHLFKKIFPLHHKGDNTRTKREDINYFGRRRPQRRRSRLPAASSAPRWRRAGTAPPAATAPSVELGEQGWTLPTADEVCLTGGGGRVLTLTDFPETTGQTMNF